MHHVPMRQAVASRGPVSTTSSPLTKICPARKSSNGDHHGSELSLMCENKQIST
jgi:hypothetical protein